jgi:thiol peroxidase
MERKGIITFNGNPMTLIGVEPAIGKPAPEFTVIDGELKPVKLSDYKGDNLIISSVPSLDTPVCELQTKKFNEEAARLKAKILTISMDLPFAQNRFCKSFNIGNIKICSDYKDREFGQKFGLLIKELGLLTRAVFIIDKDGKVIYKQIVKEVTNEPKYDEVIDAFKKIEK